MKGMPHDASDGYLQISCKYCQGEGKLREFAKPFVDNYINKTWIVRCPQCQGLGTYSFRIGDFHIRYSMGYVKFIREDIMIGGETP